MQPGATGCSTTPSTATSAFGPDESLMRKMLLDPIEWVDGWPTVAGGTASEGCARPGPTLPEAACRRAHVASRPVNAHAAGRTTAAGLG